MLLTPNNNKVRKSQSMAEVGVLLPLVVAAFFGMQVYLRRGLQARYKSTVDAAVLSAHQAANEGETGFLQYEPYYQQREQRATLRTADRENFEGEDRERRLYQRQYFVQSVEGSSTVEPYLSQDRHWFEFEEEAGSE